MAMYRFARDLERYGASGPPRPLGVTDDEWTIFTRRWHSPVTIRALADELGLPIGRIRLAEARVWHRVWSDEKTNRDRCPTCGGTGHVPREEIASDD